MKKDIITILLSAFCGAIVADYFMDKKIIKQLKGHIKDYEELINEIARNYPYGTGE